MIKSFVPTHTCVRVTSANKTATSGWMANKLVEPLREDSTMSMECIKTFLSVRYGIQPTYMQIYRARVKALAAIEGPHGESFSKLRVYANEVLRLNPSSIVKLDVGEGNPHPFRMMFMS